MPELPEVEAARAFVQLHCLGRKIENAVVADDDKVIVGIGFTELESALRGRKLLKAQRKGKHMWLDFDTGPALMLHFGMTGSICVRGQQSVKYVMTKEGDPELWPPRFWKLHFNFSGDVQMAFCDPRRFARVRLQEEPEKNEPVVSLGFDVLAGVPPVEELARLLARKRGALKSILLDQAFSAGVGNWVADEVCHAACIHPEQRGMDLSRPQLESLRLALISVPRAAVDVDADSSRFPKDWIFHQRWDEKSARAGISFLKIGGRTTAIETKLQKLVAVSKPAAVKARGVSKGGKPVAAAAGDAGNGVGKTAAAGRKFRKNGPVKGSVSKTPKEPQKVSTKEKAEVMGRVSKSKVKAKIPAAAATLKVKKTTRQKK